jgi:hypothetical protein
MQNAASLFDEFARGAVGKTVVEVANNLAQSYNKEAAAQFIMAAKHMGLTPKSQLTPQVLSDPATAAPLGRAAGIGTYLSDYEWRQAHAIAWQIARARGAASN